MASAVSSVEWLRGALPCADCRLGYVASRSAADSILHGYVRVHEVAKGLMTYTYDYSKPNSLQHCKSWTKQALP